MRRRQDRAHVPVHVGARIFGPPTTAHFRNGSSFVYVPTPTTRDGHNAWRNSSAASRRTASRDRSATLTWPPRMVARVPADQRRQVYERCAQGSAIQALALLHRPDRDAVPHADQLFSQSLQIRPRRVRLIYAYEPEFGHVHSEMEEVVRQFVRAAVRVREAGCDGLEVTASKGYLIHQFLNPATNRRTDRYGGSAEKRFRLLREVVSAVRQAVGRDYLFGIRLSANDFNYLPVNLRWPPVWPPRRYWFGNTIEENLATLGAQGAGVDYCSLHGRF